MLLVTLAHCGKHCVPIWIFTVQTASMPRMVGIRSPPSFRRNYPQFFIEHLSDVEDVVFDPMLGSGTTLVEAMRLGRRVIGCDIDPLARMIAAAKLTPMKAAKNSASRISNYRRD